MADWAVCYPEKVPECPPGDDSDADVEGEFGEEGQYEAQLCTGPPVFRETQTATVSLIRQIDAGDGDPEDPCNEEVDLGPAQPYVQAIENAQKQEAAAMRSRKHFKRIPGPPAFLRSFTRQEPEVGPCGVTRESARLKAVKDLSPILYKHNTVFEEQAKDFYKRDHFEYDDLKAIWEQLQGECFVKQEKAVRSGEPQLVVQRDNLRQDICVMLATIDCFNREIIRLMECDEYKLAVMERAELLDKLAKYSSEVKRQEMLLDLAREEADVLMLKDRAGKFIRPELVGKCECSEYTSVLEEIAQLTIDNDKLAAEFQLWSKLTRDFSKASRELLRTMITDWNVDGEVHKNVRTMVCFTHECIARDMVKCVFQCPDPEQIPRLLCCELDCAINSAKIVRENFPGI